MIASLEQIKDAATILPASQRAELAHFLLQSLEPEEEGAVQAWHEELELRRDQIESGKVVGVPVEEVLARLRERYP